MADLTLSAERHDELAALLDDEQRLQTEYPKVAQYLDMAVGLSGTGDARADHAFDLRFIHYMTGGDEVSEDPYWDIVGPSVSEHEGRRLISGGKPDGSPKLAFAQIILQEVYAYAVPSPETVRWVSEVCGGRPVVELGAGRGYWAKQLGRAGVSVSAYDVQPPDQAENLSARRGSGHPDVWHPVGDLDSFAVRLRERSADTVLFLCWPPGWGSSMASDALVSFEALGGERLLFVGQGKGGQTGDDAFFDRLGSNWALESTDQYHVSWCSSVDVAQLWVRTT